MMRRLDLFCPECGKEKRDVMLSHDEPIVDCECGVQMEIDFSNHDNPWCIKDVPWG
jgi:uncharacterized Zn finger protein